MSIENNLIKAGYKKHVSQVYYVLHMTDTLYQKCVKDDVGKRYFINCFYYPESRISGQSIPEGVMFQVQFWTIGKKNDDKEEYERMAVDITLHTNDIDIVEGEFEEIWKRMGYGYYEKWEE